MFSKPFASSQKLFQQFEKVAKRFNSTNFEHKRFNRFKKPIFDNPFNEYIKREGDRPKVLQQWYFEGLAAKVVIFTSIAVPFWYLFSIQDYRGNVEKELGTNGPIEEFKEYKKMRDAKRKQDKAERQELAALESEIYGTPATEKKVTAKKPTVTTETVELAPGIEYSRIKISGQDVYVASAVQEEEVHVGSAATSADNQAFYKYIIIGGGTAAYYAMKEIKKNDPKAQILLISEEEFLPYCRPPLSKELWASKDPKVAENLKYKDYLGKERKTEYEPAEYYAKNNITFKKSTVVTKLDPSEKTVTTSDGSVIKFDKCLLATGGSPIIVPGMDAVPDKAMTFRTAADFQKLDAISRMKDKEVVVVGGSFLGTELSYALAAQRGAKVTQVFLEPEVLARSLPRYLTSQVRDLLVKSGVDLKPNRNVIAVSQRPDGKVAVKLDGGEEYVTDFVLSAIGIYPNTDLAEAAGLEIDPIRGGVVTNSELEARNGVFVAGDVLSYYDTILGRRRIEHYQHASSTGKAAGQNMSSSKRVPFNHLSMFWSDVGPLNFEAVGEISSNLNTYAVWDGVDVFQNGSPWNHAPAPTKTGGFNRGIVYFLREKRVVGVLLWNVHGKIDEARKIIASKTEVKEATELKDMIQIPPNKT